MRGDRGAGRCRPGDTGEGRRERREEKGEGARGEPALLSPARRDGLRVRCAPTGLQAAAARSIIPLLFPL